MSEAHEVKNPWEQKDQQMEQIKNRMNKIQHKIAIISGKGGVGKSLVTVNLAMGLADNGRVAILDADLTGPCVPKMLGLKGTKMRAGPTGIAPVVGPKGVEVVSMDFLLPNDEAPVIWRGPLKMGAIRQFLGEVAWGEQEFLLVDLPPGTGDESLSILQLLPEMDGVIIVTIPSEVSQAVVKKAITFARKMNVPVFGIVENMSGMICPHCGETINVFSEGGGAKVSEEMNVELLGSIPMDPKVSVDSDAGVPFILNNPDSPASKAFREIIEKIVKKVK
ncbi:MAG: Mrp/NBP35 family ATP-binding protein [Candidatus Bathyarchaeota archaeon]|nr:Mrp/NBP35 family ATP-binding protein [Candidatus Bathyarchaeota archaeon]